MKTSYIFLMALLLLLGFWVFASDYYMASTVKEKDALTYKTQKEKLLWLVDIPKNIISNSNFKLDQEIKNDQINVPIHKLKFYQEEYQKIPNVICDEYDNLKLARNYILDLSTYENKKLLDGVKMFELKWNENPDGNAAAGNDWDTNSNITSETNTEDKENTGTEVKETEVKEETNKVINKKENTTKTKTKKSTKTNK